MPLYYAPPRLACWGDSLTIGLTGALAKALRGAFQVENYGVGGETSTQIKTRLLAASSAIKALPTVIWAGRNNFNDPTTVLADVASMVAALTGEYLILSVVNGEGGSSEYVGGAGYANIQTINAQLAAAYPSRYFDLRRFLVAQANARVPQDVIDQGHDTVPSSIRVDTVHLTPTGYAVAAAELAPVLAGEMFQTVGTVLDLPIYPVAGGKLGVGVEAPLTRVHVDHDSGYGALLVSNQKKHATASLFVGIAGGSDAIINGDALGDVCVVANSPGGINFSGNNGGAMAFKLRNDNSVKFLKYITLAVGTPPATPPVVGLVNVGADQDGGGKHRLWAQFHTGAVQYAALEP